MTGPAIIAAIQTSDHDSLPNQTWWLTVAALLVTAAVIGFCIAFPGSYLLLIVGIVGASLFLVTAAWRPEALLVGCAFMPQWKNVWPLDRFSNVGDLTVLMLLGLLVGVIWRSLRHVGKLEKESLSELFRGQWLVLFSYALFCAAVLASYGYTSAPHYGGVKLTRFLLIGTLFLLSGIVLVRNQSEFRRVALFFVVAACVTATQMIFHLEHRSATAETDITRIGADGYWA